MYFPQTQNKSTRYSTCPGLDSKNPTATVSPLHFAWKVLKGKLELKGIAVLEDYS